MPATPATPAMPAFDGRSAALSFDPSAGLSDGTLLIPAAAIISLQPSADPAEFTLLHTHADTDDDDDDDDGTPSPRLHRTLLAAPPAALLARYTLAALPPHLDPAAVDITVVVSTGSGTGRALPYWLDVVQPLLASYGLPAEAYAVHVTASAGTIHAVAAGLGRTTAARPQSLVLLSGDTLLFELLNSLPPLPVRPVVCLLPLGTGNALSASLSRASPPLSTLLLGAPRPLPVFRARFSPGARFVLPHGAGHLPLPPDGLLRAAVVLSWGFHASLVADSDSPAFRALGPSRFALAAKANLLPAPHAYRGAVSLLLPESSEWTTPPSPAEDHFYTLATLVSHLEPSFCVSPASRPLQAQLRTVRFAPRPPAEVMQLMALAYDGGKHVLDARVAYDAVRGVRVVVCEAEERWRRVCVDGAVVVMQEGGSVEVCMEEEEGGVDVVYRGE